MIEESDKLLTSMLPDQFSEYYLRIFVKDDKNAKDAKQAFDRYLSKFNF